MLWLIVAFGAYVLLLAGMAWFSLHPPRTPVVISPAILGAPQQTVRIDSDGLSLKAWWVPARPPGPVMVVTHGYLMNGAELTPVAYHLWKLGISCLIIDFRAHGKSAGRKCTLGHVERRDVRAAVEWVRRECGPDTQIGIIGSSMGSAAAALACGDDPELASCLILDSSYSWLPNAILGWWRFLGGRLMQILLYPCVYITAPLAGFNPFQVDVAKALTAYGQKPVLILHGTSDSLALPSEARRNLAACKGPSKIVWFEGSGHTEGRYDDPGRYLAEVEAFLREQGFCGSATVESVQLLPR